MSDTKLEPILNVTYRVIAYDCAGYGDDRSCDFKSGNEAVKYAEGLSDNFNPLVIKIITMTPMHITIYDRNKV